MEPRTQCLYWTKLEYSFRPIGKKTLPLGNPNRNLIGKKLFAKPLKSVRNCESVPSLRSAIRPDLPVDLVAGGLVLHCDGKIPAVVEAAELRRGDLPPGGGEEGRR